jgi:hypothetical protein
MSDADDDFDEEAFEARYEERRQRMLTQPPRCLSPFAAERASAADLPGVVLDGHGSSLQSVFRLRCRCGGESFHVRGTHIATDFKGDPLDFLGDPLELTCPSCRRTELLFDRYRHGYDAEIDAVPLPPREDRRPAPRTEYACPHCGGDAMTLWARFEHNSEACEDSFADRLGGGPEQDFFSWLTVAGRCAKCDRLQTVTEFETA